MFRLGKGSGDARLGCGGSYLLGIHLVYSRS